MMNPDDELCLCFHVSRRKVEKWIRLEKPARVGQLSECYGAGTGCGWCRPFLRTLFENAEASQKNEQADLPSAEEYAQQRAEYRAKKREGEA